MLAVQLIKISWSKNSRDPRSVAQRKELFFPARVEWEQPQNPQDIFLSSRECFYLSEKQRAFWHDYYKKQNLYRRHRKNEVHAPAIASVTPSYFQRMADTAVVWKGRFYPFDEINRNTIPCIRIIQEEDGYRVRWFSQTGLLTQPFRRGGNEDACRPDTELYCQLNTLNETAFVLSEGQSGEIRYNFRLTDRDDGTHTYTEYRVYMVNTPRLTQEVFVREYDYVYKQLAKLY